MLTLCGENRIILGIACIYPSGTVKVRNVKTSQIMYRQDESWHTENTEFQEGSSLSVGSGRRG